jgi:hypothetical protein
VTIPEYKKLEGACEPTRVDSADAAALKLAIAYLALNPYPGGAAMDWAIRYLSAELPGICERLNQ